MSLSPLLQAPLAIQLHAFAALAALAIGIVQLVRTEGDGTHKAVGWLWVTLMATVATTSFFIHAIDQWRGWSLIHLLAIYTLVGLTFAVAHARSGRIEAHRKNMIYLFAGALLIAGLFTLAPGRVMHNVLFGS